MSGSRRNPKGVVNHEKDFWGVVLAPTGVPRGQLRVVPLVGLWGHDAIGFQLLAIRGKIRDVNGRL